MDKSYECTCVYLWSTECLFVSTCTCGCVCMCSPGRDEGRTWFIVLRSIKAESPIKMHDRPIKIQTGPKPVVGKPRFRLGTRQNVFYGLKRRCPVLFRFTSFHLQTLRSKNKRNTERTKPNFQYIFFFFTNPEDLKFKDIGELI